MRGGVRLPFLFVVYAFSVCVSVCVCEWDGNCIRRLKFTELATSRTSGTSHRALESHLLRAALSFSHTALLPCCSAGAFSSTAGCAG